MASREPRATVARDRVAKWLPQLFPFGQKPFPHRIRVGCDVGARDS